MIYSKEYIQALKCRAITKKVMGHYVRFKRIRKRTKGKFYIAICPFHKEKTKSFTLHERFYGHKGKVPKELWSFKCFGCGASGDIFTFIMKKEDTSFLNSVRIIKKILGEKRQKFPPRNSPDFHKGQYQIPFLEK